MKKLLIFVALLTLSESSLIPMKQADQLQVIDQRLQEWVALKAAQDKNFSWLPAKISMLLKNKDLNATDDLGNTRLHYAAFMLFFPLVNILIRNGADPAKQNNKGQDPLAIIEDVISKENRPQKQNEFVDEYKKLVQHLSKMNMSQLFADNYTLLHKAIKAQDAQLLAQLLANKANPNAASTSGITPLMYAAEFFQNHISKDIMDALLAADANPDAANNNKETALHILVSDYLKYPGDPKYVQVLFSALITLIMKTKNLNAQDMRGNTPLYLLAATLKDVQPTDVAYQLIEKLLSRGASANIQNKDGFTPLHAAVNPKNLELVKLLLKYGANPYIRSYIPRTTAQIRSGQVPVPDKTPRQMAEEIAQGMRVIDQKSIIYIQMALLQAEQQMTVPSEPTTIPPYALAPQQQRLSPLKTALLDLVNSLQELQKNLI